MSARHSAVLERILALDRRDRHALLRSLSPSVREALRYEWGVWGRPDQIWRPVGKRVTVYMAGRGWGKTRTGSEAVRHAIRNPEICGGQIAIAGRTNKTTWRECIDGVSGLLSVMPESEHPVRINRTEGLLEWSNGVVVHVLSGDKPQSFRGPNVGLLWMDELPHWQRADESLATAKRAVRHIGWPSAGRTWIIVTSTPLGTPVMLKTCFELDDAGRPLPDPSEELGFKLRGDVQIVRGSTYDNEDNLAEDYMDDTRSIEGTRLALQEVHGEILLGVPTAIWNQTWFQHCEPEDVPELAYRALYVDPSVSEHGRAAEAGLIAMGMADDGRIFLLEDGSGPMSPRVWGKKALSMWSFHDCDEVLVEDNNGGELVRTVLQQLPEYVRYCRIEKIRATKSKEARARAVAPAWELRRVWHVGDPRRWVRAEHQLTHWDPTHPAAQRSDRMDAITHGVAHMIKERVGRRGSRLGAAEVWGRIARKVSEL